MHVIDWGKKTRSLEENRFKLNWDERNSLCGIYQRDERNNTGKLFHRDTVV